MARPLLVLAAALCLALPGLASGQSQVWWGASVDDSGANTANDVIARVGTNGLGAAVVRSNPVSGGGLESQPIGLAADLAQGRIFWTDYTHQAIYRSDLDGANTSAVAATGSQPYELAFDGTAERLYWVTNAGTDRIMTAPADGGSAQILYDNPANSDWIRALAISPRSNRLYWGNMHWDQPDSNLIGVARLDGTGVLPPIDPVQCAPLHAIDALAVDDVQGVIYRVGQLVSNNNAVIQAYQMDTGACDTVLQRDGSISGVAHDPDHNRLIYGADASPSVIGWVNLVNSVEGGTLTTDPAPIAGVRAPMVLSPPQATSNPAIATTGTQVGATLSCDPVVWAESSPGMNLYRDPTGYGVSWQRNGAAVDGAVAPDLTPTQPGEYRCVRSATNAIGTTAATSAAIALAAVPTPGASAPAATTPAATPPAASPSARLIGRIGVRRLTRGQSLVTARVQLSAGTWSVRLARGARTVRLLKGSRLGATTLARPATRGSLAVAAPAVVTLRLRTARTSRAGLALWLAPTMGGAIVLR